MHQWRTFPRCWLFPSPAHSDVQGAEDTKPQETNARSQARGQLVSEVSSGRAKESASTEEAVAGQIPYFSSAVAILLFHDPVKGSSDHCVSPCCKHSGATDTHPRARPMFLAALKKDFPLVCQSFLSPSSFMPMAWIVKLLQGYTQSQYVSTGQEGVLHSYLWLTGWVKAHKYLSSFWWKKNECKV